MRETEIKSIIDEDTYERVDKAFTWESVKEQENHYYTDAASLLREKRVMVRVRVVDDTAKIQVKVHKNDNSPLQICEENEFETDGAPETIDADTAKKITGMDVGELRRMGSSVTLRKTFTHNGSELCLDKTEYFQKTDYEVEMEYSDKMSAELLMKLNSLGVMFDKKSVGKFSRFLDEYLKNRG